MFNTLLRDNVKARKQLPDGTYVYKINEDPPVNAQQKFIDEAYRKADKKSTSKRSKSTHASNTASAEIKPKRGGRPKNTAAKAEETKEEPKVTETTEPKPKKRAGRPKKTEQTAPKKAGRPKKAVSETAKAETTAPKKRGRAKKAAETPVFPPPFSFA